MSKWHLIQNQPLLGEIFKEPPIISYKKGKSLRVWRNPSHDNGALLTPHKLLEETRNNKDNKHLIQKKDSTKYHYT